MFFSVSLELRCVLGFWESYPDRLWFVPNFLERSFNLIWTVSDFQIFTDFTFAEILWQRTLSHIFCRWFLFKKILVKTFSSDVFGRSFSSILVWTGITLLRFSVRISLQRIFGSDFSSNIFGTYFLFRVFVWIKRFFQVLFVRDFFWEFICRSFLVKISLDIVWEISLELYICFVDFFLKYFSVEVSFENCFVEIPLLGVCGRFFYSNTFR